MWRTGFVALCRVGSSQIRDWTHVSCIGRWILYHRATMEALLYLFNVVFPSVFAASDTVQKCSSPVFDLYIRWVMFFFCDLFSLHFYATQLCGCMKWWFLHSVTVWFSTVVEIYFFQNIFFLYVSYILFDHLVFSHQILSK